jgi:hypothetical protein
MTGVVPLLAYHLRLCDVFFRQHYLDGFIRSAALLLVPAGAGNLFMAL